ncbi:efflux RND transporter permease subunit [candidate division FCPU426 bacterium]|nr:efflux RND transporter permease subunit [candidate division FCPU426 bacterium]
MINQLIEYSLKNKYIVLLFTGLAVLWGMYALTHISLDAVPDLSDTQVIVFSEWPGRSPDLVEDQISYPIISTLLAAPKVKTVRGYSMFGMSFVYVIFKDGTDIYWARSRILEYLSKLQEKLPEGVTPTLGPDATGVGWVYQYALEDTSGKNDLYQLRAFQDWYLRYWLESIEGVAEVASVGGFEKQYQITLDPHQLLSRNLTLRHVVEQIRQNNNDVGGRVVEMSGREYFVRGRGYIKSLDDIRLIGLGVDDKGTPVYLKDVAQVSLGPEIRRGAADLDGRGEAVGGIVVMRYGENALRVIERVKKRLQEIQPSLPAGVKVRTVYDRSGIIKRSIATLTHTLFEEGLMVALVILLFLLQWRGALVAVVILPVAVLISFIPMYYLGISSNIMSLGGIAIAIGAMVDAAIVLVENVNKKLEKYQQAKKPLLDILIEATGEVGKPVFFSLLVITVSFLPIFTLEAQEGKLFKPLAYTKTFTMFFAALVSITLAPALLSLLTRRKAPREEDNPINRWLIGLYLPAVRWALEHSRLVLGAALGLLLLTVPLFLRLGAEFMPPLNEGSILYMPTTLPGISIAEAKRMLTLQDRIIKTFPEVESVFGKVGRAKTATDPAPLSMVETTIMLKDKKRWRQGMTWKKLISELDQAVKFPGWTNAWTMPIKGRIDMLTTGIRTPVGIKVFGPDLRRIEEIGITLENILQTTVPGTRSVYFERVTGGYFIDFKPRRKEIARYGLSMDDVFQMIETAIGGMPITVTVEGPERYAVNVRYSRELRDHVEKLKKVYVPTPAGAQIPVEQLAEIQVKTGPPMIKDENGSLSGWVYVDIEEARDIGGYVRDAKQAVRQQLALPAGYRLSWTGQYEFMQRVRKRLQWVVPVTLVVIFLLIYFNFKSVTETFIILLSVPFALIGGIMLMALLKYNLSIAVWVGIIALLGVAAETGIIMLVYLNESYNRYKQAGRLKTKADLLQAVIEGSVMRVRPKVMTVATTLIGLLPLMWSTGTGADVTKRIAAPMVGGLITSTILTLVIIPVVFNQWKARKLSFSAGRRKRLSGVKYSRGKKS